MVRQLCVGFTALVALMPLAASAQTYPSRPIRVIVPISPGGATDTMGRLAAQRLTEQLGVNVIVDNRPGAGTVLGTEAVAKAPADGYTLLTVAAEFVINPSLRKLPYDAVRDFTCVTQLTSGQYLLSTHPTVPVTTVKQFIALAKARPGQLTFGSSGTGSANHLAGILFQHLTHTKLVHVPYKGAGPAGVALIGGETDFMFSNVSGVIGYVKQGKLRAIAVTGEKRTPVAPEVPTVVESGVPGFVVTGLVLLLAPAGTPADAIAKLQAASARGMESPAMKERLATLGLDPVASTPAECGRFVQAEITKWAPVVKAAGMQAD